MTIVVYTPPAAEPLSVAEVKVHCRIGATQQEPAPGVITAALGSPAAAGNLDNGAHRYLATFTTADGETQAGAVSEAVTVADKTVNGKIALSGIPLGGALVTGRKLYRTAAGGSTYLLLATLANNTATTYTDNIADASLGAEAPAVNTTEDPLLRRLIAAARAAAETELHRFLVTQTLEAYFDRFPFCDGAELGNWRAGRSAQEIRLPPLQSVSSITYVDPDGATQTLAADQYQVDVKSQPARITPAYGVSWPATRQQPNAVTIRFVAGYGAAADVPACVKQWMLLKIAAAWENRSPLIAGSMDQLPTPYVDGLLDSERVTGRI